MLNSTASHLTLAQNSASLGIHHILGHSIHDGLRRHIDALNLVTMIDRSRQEGDGEIESRVQTLSAE